MSTYGEIVYMVLDEVKGMSDDFTYSEEHILYLIDTTRAFLLKQKYSDVKKQIPYANYQTIYTEVEESALIDDALYSKANYLKTKNKIPDIIPLAIPRIFTSDYYQGEITYISRDRMRYVGYNKYLKNIRYCAIDENNLLCVVPKEGDDFSSFKNLRLTSIFEDPRSIQLDSTKHWMDNEFPLEEALITSLIEMTVNALAKAVTAPTDTINNGTDENASMPTVMKSGKEV